MKTYIDLAQRTGRDVGQMLNRLLADEYVLYTTTRDYVWNLTGPEIHDLQHHLETHCEMVSGWISQIAKRACAVGEGVRSNWNDLVTTARSAAEPGIGLSAEHMLAQLIALHEELMVQLLADSEACSERLLDTGTADFFTRLIAQHGKAAWLLRAQLDSEGEKVFHGEQLGIQRANSQTDPLL